MRVLKLCAALAAVTISAGAALAGSQGYPGDMYLPGQAGFAVGGSDQPLLQAYPGPNMCTQGKQPVIAGGQIWCDVPTGGTYYNPANYVAPRAAAVPLPRAYAPVGEKGVAYQ